MNPKRPKWTDVEITVKLDDYAEFEDWCLLNRLRFDHAPDPSLGRPVPTWGYPKTATNIPTPAKRVYKVWGKWPDRVMFAKLTWAGR